MEGTNIFYSFLDFDGSQDHVVKSNELSVACSYSSSVSHPDNHPQGPSISLFPNTDTNPGNLEGRKAETDHTNSRPLAALVGPSNYSRSEPACPFNLDEWSRLTVDMPNQALRDYVIQGLLTGFPLRFGGGPLVSATKNSASAYAHAGVVDEYLQEEIRQGSIADCRPISLSSHGQFTYK